MKKSSPTALRDSFVTVCIAFIVIPTVVVFALPWFLRAVPLTTSVQSTVQRQTPVPMPTSELEPSVVPVPLIVAQEEITAQENTDTAKLLFLGDIMLARTVRTHMDTKGLGYPFEKIHDALTGYDAVIANLEGPIIDNPPTVPVNVMRFGFDPDVVPVLAGVGVTAVSLANNHTMDHGETGYEQTKQLLSEGGIAHFGHPATAPADAVWRTSIQGHPVVFVGFHTAVGRHDTDEMVERIRTVAADDKDFVIVNIHWGSEYQPRSNAAQQNLAHAFIDAGADAIIGHHPHVVQEIEIYNDTLIVYSLGNFIFDQYFSRETQEGIALRMALTADAVTYEIVPFTSSQSQPMLLGVELRSAWLQSLAQRSSASAHDAVLGGQISLTR